MGVWTSLEREATSCVKQLLAPLQSPRDTCCTPSPLPSRRNLLLPSGRTLLVTLERVRENWVSSMGISLGCLIKVLSPLLPPTLRRVNSGIRGERERNPALLCSLQLFLSRSRTCLCSGPHCPHSFPQVSRPPPCHSLLHLSHYPHTLGSRKASCQGCLPCPLPISDLKFTSNPFLRTPPDLVVHTAFGELTAHPCCPSCHVPLF